MGRSAGNPRICCIDGMGLERRILPGLAARLGSFVGLVCHSRITAVALLESPWVRLSEYDIRLFGFSSFNWSRQDGPLHYLHLRLMLCLIIPQLDLHSSATV